MSSASRAPRLPGDFGSIEYLSKAFKEESDSESSDEEEREARRPWRHQIPVNNRSTGALQHRIVALEHEIQQSTAGLPADHAQRLIERYQSAKLAEATVQAAGPGQARHQLDAALAAARRELRVGEKLTGSGGLGARTARGSGLTRSGALDECELDGSSSEEEEPVSLARAQAVSWEESVDSSACVRRGASVGAAAEGRRMETVMEE